MPVEMQALRRHYHRPHRKEYAKGEPFTVGTENEAESLVRHRRAARVGTVANPSDLPTKVMGEALTAEGNEPAPLEASPRPRRAYRRRDMTPED